jgi:hypothetical protein
MEPPDVGKAVGQTQGSLIQGGVASESCETAFQPCGGLLAGSWQVLDTCDSETTSRKALQIWGQTLMGLDSTACWDAVQAVTSKWTGQLQFDQGVATDNRQRSDTVEMDLSASCLSATFGVTVKDSQMPAVCDSLTTATRSCTLTSGVCRCTSQHVSVQDASGTYGVLGESVAIGEPASFYDYCITTGVSGSGDTLLWRDPSSTRHLVLQRTAASATPFDPEYPR